MAYENTSFPKHGDKSCGCFDCKGGKDEILQSKTRGPVSVALCKKCIDKAA